jgi:hypothetical protein
MKNFNLKKIIYVILSIFLGKLLGFLIFELFTLRFIRSMSRQGLPVIERHIFGITDSPLPAYLFWLLILFGALGGFIAGLRWWQMVYVEKRHWRMRGK